MAQRSERVRELEEGLLAIGEKIDSCDQSRIELANTQDEIREIVADLYGDDFDSDLLEHMGYENEESASEEE